jgi:hypothetical protein
MWTSIERAIVLWAACFAPPAEPWHEADDLETCETICAERTLSAADRTEAEEIVIDLDRLGPGNQSINAGDGLTLELEHRLPHELIILVDEETDLCEVPLPLEIELRPVPIDQASRLLATDELPVLIEDDLAESDLILLPTHEADRRDEQTARFQRAYSAMLSQGRRKEADALAVQFLDADSSANHDFPKASTSQHRVGYRPPSGRGVRTYPGNGSARWSEVSHRQITVRFEETPIDELARFLRWATGLTVEIDLPAQLADELRCHVQCSDVSIAETVAAIGQQLGIVIRVEEDRLTLLPRSR